MLLHLYMDMTRVLLLIMGTEIKFMGSIRASLKMCNSHWSFKGCDLVKNSYFESISFHQTLLNAPVLQ